MTTSILKLLADSCNKHLTDEMQTFIAANDQTRAGMVRPGLLQDDPTRFKVSILTFFNDPDQDGSWRNEIVSQPSNPAAYHSPPPYELGGGEMWWRRFSTLVEMFFGAKVTRDEARDLATTILSRAELAVAKMPIAFSDDFGEEALETRVMSSTLVQGGGEGQFIFHGKLWFQVLTGKTLPDG